MLEFINSLPEWFQLAIIGGQAFVFLFIGFKIGGFARGVKTHYEKKGIKSEQEVFQKNLKQVYDAENSKLKNEYAAAIEKNETLEKRLEDYRKKISGLGILNFSGNQKRADILYSLLLENETLEMLLHSQGSKMMDMQKQHLEEKLIDIRKRQRFISEIFNDSSIKNYINETLNQNFQSGNSGNKYSDAEKRIEYNNDDTNLPKKN